MGDVLTFPLERRFDEEGNRIGDYRGEADVVILPVIRIERHQDHPTRRRANYARRIPITESGDLNDIR